MKEHDESIHVGEGSNEEAAKGSETNAMKVRFCPECGSPVEDGEVLCGDCRRKEDSQQESSGEEPQVEGAQDSGDAPVAPESACEDEGEAAEAVEDEKSDSAAISESDDSKKADFIKKLKPLKEKVNVKTVVVAMVLLIVFVCVFGVCHHRDWYEATCVEPKTCVECGTTEGAPLGHVYGKYVVVKKPTCTENGTEEAKCSRCSDIVSRSLETVDHTPGEWEVAVQPSIDSSGNATEGEWVINCTVCGEKLESEPYVLSASEVRAAYKDGCWHPSYEELARDPEGWDGYKVALKGEVMQVTEGTYADTILLQVTHNGYFWDDIVYVTYTPNDGDPRILEDDVVTFYGEMDGVYTYTTVMGAAKTVPMLNALFVE